MAWSCSRVHRVPQTEPSCASTRFRQQPTPESARVSTGSRERHKAFPRTSLKTTSSTAGSAAPREHLLRRHLLLPRTAQRQRPKASPKRSKKKKGEKEG